MFLLCAVISNGVSSVLQLKYEILQMELSSAIYSKSNEVFSKLGEGYDPPFVPYLSYCKVLSKELLKYSYAKIQFLRLSQ